MRRCSFKCFLEIIGLNCVVFLINVWFYSWCIVMFIFGDIINYYVMWEKDCIDVMW